MWTRGPFPKSLSENWLWSPNYFITLLTHYTVTPRYSVASELVKPCTRCILTRKKFQHLVFARYLSHVLELVWVTTSPRKRKCFIDWYLAVLALATVPEHINDVCRGTTVCPFPPHYAVSTGFHSFTSTRQSVLQDACMVKALLWQLSENTLMFLKFLS